MEPTIHLLSEELCNQIAAGEVVERPASVVKELIENSLDAAATSIRIDLQAGGKRLIQVEDNGCGMNRQDAFLSFERHATSKISSAEDLFALQSLGFRGEALASIAAVSRLRLQTSAADDGQGLEIYAEGGQIKRADELGRPRGTRVEVRNLFFNLPARKKFLRKEQTELGHAAEVVTRQALAHPEVSFRLRNNDRALVDLPRETGLEQRVAALLGRSLLRDLLPVESNDDESLRLQGLISQPQLNRSASSHIYTFINGRYIRDRVVQHAIMEGYRHLLMKGRYPVVVLFLAMDPALVDVNVHPTKHEVRFHQQAQVHDFIVAALRQCLRPASWVAEQQQTSPKNDPQSSAPRYPDSAQAAVSESYPTNRFKADDQSMRVRETAPPTEFPGVAKTWLHEKLSRSNSWAVPEESGEVAQQMLPGSRAEGFFSGLQILGQYHQSYLLCQDGDDLVLIDQHAAHERVAFEDLRRDFHGGRIATQALLLPEMLELDFKTAAALQENLAELQQLGFEVEPFGGNSFALKAVPQLLAQSAAGSLVIDVALELDRIGRSDRLRLALDEVLILMACHSVIRANQALSKGEIKALFAAMDEIDFKANCPHGRPVMQRLTLAEVERLFRRQ